jgi:hypothetical protein
VEKVYSMIYLVEKEGLNLQRRYYF